MWDSIISLFKKNLAEKAIALRCILERHEDAALRDKSRMSISPLQMLKRDMLEVEIGSSQETKKNLGKSTNTKSSL
jgi:hypothetical protein